jgi:hypothetical protein
VDDDRWLTYDEVADVRGTSRDGAIRWVQRRKLRRQPGNDGRVRVLVPPDILAVAPPKRAPRTDTPDAPPAVAAFETALVVIREAHAGELSTLREMLDRARAETKEAQDAAEAVRRGDLDRRAQRRWRRLLAAWRGV